MHFGKCMLFLLAYKPHFLTSRPYICGKNMSLLQVAASRCERAKVSAIVREIRKFGTQTWKISK